MANANLHIEVTGLGAMIRDFEQLESGEPIAYAAERLDSALQISFERTQALVPVDAGDKRRPAGALRDSGRTSTTFDGDTWRGEVAYGTNDDVMPYAVWARWKNVNKGKPDYMEPMTDAEMHRLMEAAMNAAFDDVFGE